MIRRFSAILIWCWCATALAQPSPPDAPSEPAVSARKDAANADRVFVQQPDGKWVPAVTEGGAGSPEQPTAPAAYIAQLQIDGDVIDDYADVTASVRVEITKAEGWYEVPLALDQALIYKSEYDGPGSAAPTVDQENDAGIRWQFQGAGTHRLELKFRLPIRATAAGHQLQLSLPTLPANYIVRAVLRIPDARVVLSDPPSNMTVHQRVDESGTTAVECDVDGPHWELGWRTAVDVAPRLARVGTAIRVQADREARLLRLTARQACTIEQGTLRELVARLPQGFDLDAVELAGSAPMSLVATENAERPGWVRVQLPDTTQRVFELEWRLARVFPAGGAAVVVDGLELEGARWQGGTIEVESIEGYGARYRAADSVALQRVDVVERRPGEPSSDFRFEFQRQPFVLSYELAPVEAQTDAAADVYLSIGGGANDLYLDVRLEVISGQVHEITIDWPNYAAGGWRPGSARAKVEVQSGGAASDIVDGSLDQDALSADPDRVRVQLSRPCTGTLRTLLRFTRAAPAEAGSLTLELPRPAATFRRIPTLTVASAVNLETTVMTAAGEPVRVPREGALPVELSAQFAAPGVRVYDLPTDLPTVTVEWTERRRSIAAETIVTVDSQNPSAVHVVQEIAYDVSFGYVSTLLLEGPADWRGGAPTEAGIAGGVGFRVQLDGQVLPAAARDGHWRIEMPDPKRGRFQLTIEHVVPVASAAGPRTVTVPILQSVDAPFRSTMVRLPGARQLRLADLETGWQTWRTRAGDSAWLSTTPRPSIQLVLDDASRSLPQQFIVDTAFVRTRFGDPGQITVNAEYAIREAPQSIRLALPEQAAAVECLWNGSSLPVRRGVETSGHEVSGEHVVTLPVAEDALTAGRLTLRYRTARARRPGLVSTYAVEFPRFGDEVQVERTYWEVVLPPGEQLYSPPVGFVPQYTWERETLLWARQPTAEYREVRSRLGAKDADAAGGPSRSNVYAYSALSAVPGGEFGAMAQELIVLIGAGLSLLLGFMFRRLPATRNLLSVLVLGFLLAVAALWQLELIQLLLQPALLGLMLAAIAARFDTGRRESRGLRPDSKLTSSATGERRSTAVPLGPAVPARTAVYQPEAAGEAGRTG